MASAFVGLTRTPGRPPPPHSGEPQVLGTDVSPDDALSVARFYEGKHELGKAGKFYR